MTPLANKPPPDLGLRWRLRHFLHHWPYWLGFLSLFLLYWLIVLPTTRYYSPTFSIYPLDGSSPLHPAVTIIFGTYEPERTQSNRCLSLQPFFEAEVLSGPNFTHIAAYYKTAYTLLPFQILISLALLFSFRHAPRREYRFIRYRRHLNRLDDLRQSWSQNTCPTCGYNTQATPTQCPECGSRPPA